MRWLKNYVDNSFYSRSIYIKMQYKIYESEIYNIYIKQQYYILGV